MGVEVDVYCVAALLGVTALCGAVPVGVGFPWDLGIVLVFGQPQRASHTLSVFCGGNEVGAGPR